MSKNNSVLTVPWLLTTLQGESVLSLTSISQIRRQAQKSSGIYPVSHSMSRAEQRLEIKGIIEMYHHYPGVWSEKLKIIRCELHRKGWRKESSLMYYFFFS